MKCEKLTRCEFFNDELAAMPAVCGLLKQTYCLGDKTRCARYQLSSAGLAVPPDLFPDDDLRAQSLLNRS